MKMTGIRGTGEKSGKNTEVEAPAEPISPKYHYRAHDNTHTLDIALMPWQDFFGPISGFGDCDGWVRIAIKQGGDFADGDISQNWKLNPPHHYDFIDINGKVIPVEKWNAERDKRDDEVHRLTMKMLRKKTPKAEKTRLRKRIEALEKDGDQIFYIVSCHAGLVGSETKLPVRHGFRTRVVGESLEMALQHTKKLWDAEVALPEKVKYKNKDPLDRKSKIVRYTIAEMKSEDPIYDFMKDYVYESKKDLEKKLAEFADYDFWCLVDHILDVEENIRTIKRVFKKHFKDQRFLAHRKAQKEMEIRHRKSHKKMAGGVLYERTSWRKQWAERRKLENAFLKSLSKIPGKTGVQK